jgi:hypothetical protein
MELEFQDSVPMDGECGSTVVGTSKYFTVQDYDTTNGIDIRL